MDKLIKIFNDYSLNLDMLDILEESGKINLGELSDLTIIDRINNETSYTAYYSNDFQGGIIIES